MQPMVEFIEHLLYTHDCVIIPNFGGFVLNTKDFRLSEDHQQILPKSKWVAFNERLKSEDGLLATLWAKEQGISQKQAFTAVSQFAEALKSKIQTDKSFPFGQIGVFSQSESGQLQFEPNQAINFDLEQYGFFPVNIGSTKNKPVLLPNQVEQSSEDLPTAKPEPKEKTKQGKFYGLLVLVFLLAGVAAFYLTEPNSRYVNSSFSPLTIRIKKTKVETKPVVVAPTDTSKKEAIAAVNHETVVDTDTSKIYLVVGSFKTEAKAAICQAELVARGFDDVKIIEKAAGEMHYRVSVGEVADFNAGYAAAARMKSEKKLDIWVYKI